MDDTIAPWTRANADEVTSPCSSPVELDLDVILQSFLDAYQEIGSLHIHSRKHADYKALTSPLESAHRCSDALLSFVNAVVGGAFVERNNDGTYLRCITALFAVSFLDRLLSLKQLVLATSMDELNEELGDDQEVVIITWIDILLVRLAEMIVVISEGQSLQDINCGEGVLSSNLQVQRSHDALRVACQLPQSLHAFPGLLHSNLASPAAKRMSLIILYAVFIIKPDIEASDPWKEVGYSPYHLIHCLRSYLDDVDQAEHAATCRTPSESIANAMAVSLYACADAAMQRTTHLNSPLFQPRTLSIILDLVRSILHTSRECGNLDADRQSAAGKATLLQWGNVTSWSWAKWTDSRIAMFETVISLTSEWLLHSPDFPSVENVEDTHTGCLFSLSPSFPSLCTFILAARSNPAACLGAIYHQANHFTEKAKSSRTNVDLICLQRTFWCLLRLLEQDDQLVNHTAAIRECLDALVEKMITIFVLLGGTILDAHVKLLVLKCLAQVNSESVECAIQQQCSSASKSLFIIRLHEGVLTAMKTIPPPANGNEIFDHSVPGHDPTGLVHHCLLLEFISQLAQNSFPLTQYCWQFLSRFVVCCSSGEWLNNTEIPAALHEEICETMLLAVSICGGNVEIINDDNIPASWSTAQKPWSDEDICSVVLHNPQWTRTRIPSAFATYIMSASFVTAPDDLIYVETWDYLRDLVVLSCTTPYDTHNAYDSIDEVELSSLEWSEHNASICKCLAYVLETVNKDIARYLANSPLTRTMLESLKTSLSGRGSHSPAILSIDRFIVEGTHLIGKIQQYIRP